MNWESLYELHADAVVRICWRILGCRADAEDCVQETFLQAFERQRLERIQNWPGLLRRIAVMTSLATLRRRKLRNAEALPADLSDETDGSERPDDVVVRKELEARLRREVAVLPDRDAAVFCLRYFESLSVSETADALDISAGAVSIALHRARRQLETRMADLLNTSSGEQDR